MPKNPTESIDLDFSRGLRQDVDSSLVGPPHLAASRDYVIDKAQLRPDITYTAFTASNIQSGTINRLFTHEDQLCIIGTDGVQSLAKDNAAWVQTNSSGVRPIIVENQAVVTQDKSAINFDVATTSTLIVYVWEQDSITGFGGTYIKIEDKIGGEVLVRPTLLHEDLGHPHVIVRGDYICVFGMLLSGGDVLVKRTIIDSTTVSAASSVSGLTFTTHLGGGFTVWGFDMCAHATDENLLYVATSNDTTGTRILKLTVAGGNYATVATADVSVSSMGGRTIHHPEAGTVWLATVSSAGPGGGSDVKVNQLDPDDLGSTAQTTPMALESISGDFVKLGICKTNAGRITLFASYKQLAQYGPNGYSHTCIFKYQRLSTDGNAVSARGGYRYFFELASKPWLDAEYGPVVAIAYAGASNTIGSYQHTGFVVGFVGSTESVLSNTPSIQGFIEAGGGEPQDTQSAEDSPKEYPMVLAKFNVAQAGNSLDYNTFEDIKQGHLSSTVSTAAGIRTFAATTIRKYGLPLTYQRPYKLSKEALGDGISANNFVTSAQSRFSGLITGGNRIDVDTAPDPVSVVRTQNNTFIACACPSIYDGSGTLEVTPHLYPEIATVHATSQNPNPNDFVKRVSFIAMAAVPDDAGVIHRSEPSQIVSVSGSTATHYIASARVYALNPNSMISAATQGYGKRAYMEIYAGMDTINVAAKISKPIALYEGGIAGISVTSVSAPLYLAKNTYIPLYAEGGELVVEAPPPFTTAVAMGTRIAAISGDDQTQCWISKNIGPAFGIEFNSELVVQIPNSQEPFKALASMDDKLLLFKPNETYVLWGEGPNNNGQGGAFGGPHLLPFNVGCNNRNAVATGPFGIIFVSPKGEVYRIGRDLTLEFIGGPIESTLLNKTIRSTTVLPYTKEVRFCLGTTSMVVWNYEANAWFLTYNTVTSLHGELWNDSFIFRSGSAFRQQTFSSTTYKQTASFTTGWIRFGNHSPQVRIRKIFIHCSGTTKPRAVLQFDESADTSETFSFTVTTGINALEIIPRRKKCNALRVRMYSTSAQGPNISKITVVYEMKNTQKYLPDARRL